MSECEHHKGKKRKIFRQVFWCIVVFLFLVLLTILLIWAILRPTKPTFTLQDVTVYAFNATIPNFLTSNFQVTLISRNPNDRIGVYYDRLETFVTYRSQQVTYRTSIPPSYQGHKEEDVWSPFVYGTNVPVAPFNFVGLSQDVTEEQLATLFLNCGQVVDCRVCGDPNSILRFAFIEFTDEEGARAALNLSGTMLGYYPLRVLPSKTAIAPVNPTFLPRSEDEREMCSRTIYCTNIDKKHRVEGKKLVNTKGMLRAASMVSIWLKVGKIEAEKMLIQMVETELEKRKQHGTYKGGFGGQSHFFGYEGRCGLPTNFDSIYCYALGYGAAAFLQSGKTG
ncbi:Pyrophosphate--fructose 6-phosphate 1-phosphotransferase subunit beta [Glycine soja]|uniref:Pyrophosphate--fructose 6-phosphate 1-phosphotransferase subunit beta n=1 Tax=Glycine soja TaxID=3848 RepID=A0A0B2RSN0_GLYSO|nr:Pyrophosphate--fructose 6-phosphate 1-phosphotransferase subunit beta [Glycine soja]